MLERPSGPMQASSATASDDGLRGAKRPYLQSGPAAGADYGGCMTEDAAHLYGLLVPVRHQVLNDASPITPEERNQQDGPLGIEPAGTSAQVLNGS